MKVGNHKVDKFEFITLSLFTLLTFTLSYFLFRYYISNKVTGLGDPQKPEIQRIRPIIHTKNFSQGKVGQAYYSDVIASLEKNHVQIFIKIDGLPEGLIMEDCNSTYDVPAVPVIPNSVTRCIIRGVPQKSGEYNVTLDAKGLEGVTNTISTLTLSVTK